MFQAFAESAVDCPSDFVLDDCQSPLFLQGKKYKNYNNIHKYRSVTYTAYDDVSLNMH